MLKRDLNTGIILRGGTGDLLCTTCCTCGACEWCTDENKETPAYVGVRISGLSGNTFCNDSYANPSKQGYYTGGHSANGIYYVPHCASETYGYCFYAGIAEGSFGTWHNFPNLYCGGTENPCNFNGVSIAIRFWWGQGGSNVQWQFWVSVGVISGGNYYSDGFYGNSCSRTYSPWDAKCTFGTTSNETPGSCGVIWATRPTVKIDDDCDPWSNSVNYVIGDVVCISGIEGYFVAIEANTNSYPPDYPAKWYFKTVAVMGHYPASICDTCE